MRQGQFVRWYDQFPNIALLIDGSETLPKAVQEDIGTALLAITREYYKVVNSHTAPKSLGADTVLSLYKSKRKQRWYDTVQPFHEATNLMLTMPKPALVQLDKRCADVVAYFNSLELSSH